MARIDAYLKVGRQQGSSDLHIAPDHPPLVRANGRLGPLPFDPLDADETHRLLAEILDESQREQLAGGADVDFTYSSEKVGRYRVNLFQKLGGTAATFRVIPSTLANLEALGLPPVVRELAENNQGLVLVTGAAGTGKSTTLAAMIDHLNRTRRFNIITLEDPVEYVHEGHQSTVIQREVGTHVDSFADGLRAALREDPDVILVGELRDLETITLAMTAAETGHLVFGTLHTMSATKTLDRMIDAVPARQKEQAAIFLSQHLRGVVSQKLVRTADGKRRKAIVEVLVNTPAIAALIMSRKIFLVPDQLQTGKESGMQLMDQALLEALKAMEIDPNEAFIHAEDKRQFQRYVTDPKVLPKVNLASG